MQVNSVKPIKGNNINANKTSRFILKAYWSLGKKHMKRRSEWLRKRWNISRNSKWLSRIKWRNWWIWGRVSWMKGLIRDKSFKKKKKSTQYLNLTVNLDKKVKTSRSIILFMIISWHFLIISWIKNFIFCETFDSKFSFLSPFNHANCYKSWLH